MRAAALLSGLLTIAGPGCAAAMPPATPVVLLVREERDGLVIAADADVQASLATTWATVSDYDHLAEFIPGMSASRELSRQGAEVIVEQRGTVGPGPFGRKFMLRLAVRERTLRSISAVAIGGDFKDFDSQYELESLGPTWTRIHYRAHLTPAIPVPAVIGLPAMRSIIGTQFSALLDEVQRRERTAR